jgi:septal ring factor EnvC (AmiA/AmiB activator)
MAWLRTKRPTTRELLRAEHRPHAARSVRTGRWIIFALLCVIGALLYLRGQEQAIHTQRIEALGRESQALRAELEQGRLQRQETQATEAQLLRRIATLSAQVERLQTDLAFFRQQKKAR